ncbi:MAG TPA: DUF86 domain-containing protein [Thermoanaerobaculia bacterium]|nr:DUF86 domain-containing protein [Thermoanaerobaculia bacterium]
MSRDDAVLLDMINAAQKIVDFKQGMDRQDFLQDAKTQSAVLHQLMILGEACKRLSIVTRDRAPQIPWRLIAGMRDNLIHEYDDVDLEEIWKTADRDVPALMKELRRLSGADEQG